MGSSDLNVFMLQMISMLPSKILKLLEIIGFSGNRVSISFGFSFPLAKHTLPTASGNAKSKIEYIQGILPTPGHTFTHSHTYISFH